MTMTPRQAAEQLRSIARCLDTIDLGDGITKSQLAARLGVSHKTIQRWLAASKIPQPAYYVGVHPRWLESQFAEESMQ